MVLMHMTGDERWLEPPYKPKRDVRLIPDPMRACKEIRRNPRGCRKPVRAWPSQSR